jgi:hypothetical protein
MRSQSLFLEHLEIFLCLTLETQKWIRLLNFCLCRVSYMHLFGRMIVSGAWVREALIIVYAKLCLLWNHTALTCGSCGGDNFWFLTLRFFKALFLAMLRWFAISSKLLLHCWLVQRKLYIDMLVWAYWVCETADVRLGCWILFLYITIFLSIVLLVSFTQKTI